MSIPIVGPIAPFTNPPINPQYYVPSKFNIAAITLGQTTTVTTTEEHDYVVGQKCRLLIPSYCKSISLNNQQGIVISIPSSTSVELTIYSAMSNAFVFVSSSTPAQIIAIADVNTGALDQYPTNFITYIPGSFIDISPN